MKAKQTHKQLRGSFLITERDLKQDIKAVLMITLFVYLPFLVANLCDGWLEPIYLSEYVSQELQTWLCVVTVSILVPLCFFQGLYQMFSAAKEKP